MIIMQKRKNCSKSLILPESHGSLRSSSKVLCSSYTVFHKTKSVFSYLQLNDYLSSPLITSWPTKIPKIYYCHPLPNKMFKSTKLPKLSLRKVNAQWNSIKFHYDQQAKIMELTCKTGSMVLTAKQPGFSNLLLLDYLFKFLSDIFEQQRLLFYCLRNQVQQEKLVSSIKNFDNVDKKYKMQARIGEEKTTQRPRLICEKLSCITHACKQYNTGKQVALGFE